jgi:hypothetical protein
MKTKLSRRAALAGAMSLVPAAAVAAVPIGADPDAELRAVDEQLRRLYERHSELQELLITEKWCTHFDRDISEISTLQRAGKAKEAGELARLRDAELREAMGPEWVAADREQDQVLNAIDNLHERMFALPARTIRGLTIKGRAAAHWNRRLWDSPLDDLDIEKKATRHLIEEVLAAAGEPPPFEAPANEDAAA